MKQITPSDIRRALERRNNEMTANQLNTGRLVHDILESHRKRKRLHQRVIAAVMSAAAAIIIGVVLWPSVNTGQPTTSDSAAHVIAALARAGIQGECTMTETRRETSDGSTVFTCRVVVHVSDSNYPDELLYGQKLLSVTATYDSIVSSGMSYTTLQTELNFTGGLQTVSNSLR